MVYKMELDGQNFTCHHPIDSLSVNISSIFRKASYCGSWFIVQTLRCYINENTLIITESFNERAQHKAQRKGRGEKRKDHLDKALNG